MSDETWTETQRRLLSIVVEAYEAEDLARMPIGRHTADAIRAALAEIARLTANVEALDHDYGALLKESNAEIARLTAENEQLKGPHARPD